MASPEEATGCINNYKSENATIRKNVSTAKAAAKPKSEKGAAKAGAVKGPKKKGANKAK